MEDQAEQGLSVSARIELYRTKQREGTMTLEDAREAMRLLRGDRMSAAAPSSKSGGKKKVSAPSIDVDDLI